MQGKTLRLASYPSRHQRQTVAQRVSGFSLLPRSYVACRQAWRHLWHRHLPIPSCHLCMLSPELHQVMRTLPTLQLVYNIAMPVDIGSAGAGGLSVHTGLVHSSCPPCWLSTPFQCNSCRLSVQLLQTVLAMTPQIPLAAHLAQRGAVVHAAEVFI